MADIKWSAFPSSTAVSASSSIVGLQGGTVNERFLVSAGATASGIALWDANSNLSANNFLEGFATTATAAATTTLTVASKGIQEFTGATTQIVVMPVTSTLVAGQKWYLINNSSGAVTVNSSGGNAIQIMGANTSMIITCVLISGTTAASWNGTYIADDSLTGAVLLNPTGDQTILNAHNLIMATGNMTAPIMLPGNLSLAVNSLTSTNTNGNINIVPNGTGVININGTTPFAPNDRAVLQCATLTSGLNIWAM